MHFGETIYTDGAGMQFRVRENDQTVYTYRPATQELVFLCSVKDWPGIAIRLGLSAQEDRVARPVPK